MYKNPNTEFKIVQAFSNGWVNINITREPIWGGDPRTLCMHLNPVDLVVWLSGHGNAIQYALPYLTAEEREFLLNGTIDDDF